jgi:hypothetical protein
MYLSIDPRTNNDPQTNGDLWIVPMVGDRTHRCF